jgi:hypothetical protein
MENNLLVNAKNHAQDKFLGKPGIVGMGIGYKITKDESTDELGVTVLVEQKVPVSALKYDDVLPVYLGTIPVDVIQVGHLRIRPPDLAVKSRTDKWRPAPGGVSIGHYQITAGTLGTVVKEKATNLDMILSNNHVLANSNNGKIKDNIFQPGPYDGGSPKDLIGQLHRFVEIDFGQMDNGDCSYAELYVRVGNLLAKLFKSKHIVKTLKINPQAINYVDAAIALPLDPSVLDDKIIDIGIVNDSKEASLGMPVRKSGRTTQTTTGFVNLIKVVATVDYGEGNSATFQNQTLTGPMSQGGDSGSLLVSADDNKAVGLLFAGSSQVTIYNPISEVLNGLQIRI